MTVSEIVEAAFPDLVHLSLAKSRLHQIHTFPSRQCDQPARLLESLGDGDGALALPGARHPAAELVWGVLGGDDRGLHCLVAVVDDLEERGHHPGVRVLFAEVVDDEHVAGGEPCGSRLGVPVEARLDGVEHRD